MSARPQTGHATFLISFHPKPGTQLFLFLFVVKNKIQGLLCTCSIKSHMHTTTYATKAIGIAVLGLCHVSLNDAMHAVQKSWTEQYTCTL